MSIGKSVWLFSARVIVIFLIASTEGSQSCLWSFYPTPPQGQAPCNPFKDGSVLSLPCQVIGPSTVTLEWYFYAPNNETVLLSNSSKYILQQRVTDMGNNLTATSLNVTFSNLTEIQDAGDYVCAAKINSSFILSQNASFEMDKPSSGIFSKWVCNFTKPLQNSVGICAEELFITQSSENTTDNAHLSKNATDDAPLSKSTSLPLFTPLISSHSTMNFSFQSTNTVLSQVPLPQFPFPDATSLSRHFSLTKITTMTSITLMLSAKSGTSETRTMKSTDDAPPFNTWFYLLSVIVVLAFLLIILVLILAMFCAMKRSSARRLIHMQPNQVQPHGLRIIRQPSDPLPAISDTANNEELSEYLSRLPNYKKGRVIKSNPINDTTNHALSLQHLSFNLAPSFQSNSTLYEEIASVDIEHRGSHDYINRWQFTIHSDSSSGSCMMSNDARPGILNGNLTHELHSSQPDESTGIATEESMCSSESMWFNCNSPTTQLCVPWDDDAILDSNEILTEASGSIVLPDTFTEGDDDGTTHSNCCLMVNETSRNDVSTSFTADSLDGRVLQLDLSQQHSLQHDPIHFLPSSQLSTLLSDGTSTTTTNYSAQFPHPCSATPSNHGTEDSSRSSSSSSGCTDVSKYSGDYDRDPNYMRLMLSRMGSAGEGHTSFLNSTYGTEVRTDSGMESLYADSVPPGSLYPHPCVSNVYKSLNNLSLEPEPTYAKAS